MDPERPKSPVEKVAFALPKQPEKSSQEIPAVPEITPEQREKSERKAAEKIEKIRKQLSVPENAQSAEMATSSPLTVSEGDMRLSVNSDTIKNFLVNQGLSEDQAADLKIEFGKLRWSNKATRFIVSFLPNRFREIFTRIESLKGNTLKIFTNNLDSIYDINDVELVARDTIHHLAHFAQKKKGMSRFTHFLTRLPIIHGLSKYEKEARNIANEADLENGPWADMIQFSSQREQGNDRLKIKV